MLNRASPMTVALALAVLTSTNATAAAQRTFVASNGLDTNSCSLPTPCRSFARAITQTNAGGEVIVLDSAGYGPVTITQSVTITAPSGVYAGISVVAGDGVTINNGSIAVVLRGLTINGQGGDKGINILNGASVHVENCVIAGLADSGIKQFAGTLEVKDTIVRDGGFGVYVEGPGLATLDHVRLEGNATGLAAEYNGHVAMQDSVVTHSSNIGVVAAYGNSFLDTSSVVITRSLISFNQYGIYLDPGTGASTPQVRVSDSTISDSSAWGVWVAGTEIGSPIIEAIRTTIVRDHLGSVHLSGTAFGTFNSSHFSTLDAAAGSWVNTYNNNAVLSGGVYGGVRNVLPLE